MEQQNMKQQRKKYAFTSALLSLALIITGTFAWTSIRQGVVNDFTLGNPGGRIHDDYSIEAVENRATNTANKDIYAENFGGDDLLVRIKLSEYLGIDGTPVIADTDPDEKDTWVPYIIDNIDDAQDNTEATRDYVDWTMGGDKIFLPTFNLQTDSSTPDSLALATDASGDAIDDVKYALTSGVTGSTAPGDGSHDYFTEDNDYDLDGNDYGPASAVADTHVAKSTISHTIDVMSMQDWMDDQLTGNFWVVDTDGWAYWANLLAPGEATSLLLDELTFSNLPSGEIYYAIDVKGEFSTTDDLINFTNDTSAYGNASAEAAELLNIVANVATYSIEFAIDVEDITMAPNASKSFTARIMKTDYLGNQTEETSATINYELTGGTTGTEVSETGTVTIGDSEPDGILTLTITAPDYGLTIEITINVTVSAFTIPAVGETFTDPDGTTLWRVLAKDGGNVLIITEYVYNYNTTTPIIYNTSNVFKLYENSNLKNHATLGMDAWYTSNVGDTLKSIALDYEYQTAAGALDENKGIENTGAGIEYLFTGANYAWNAGATADKAKTKAGGNKGTATNTKAFALSISEANTYMNTTALRTAYDVNATGTVRLWWLRSPGTTSLTPASVVSTDGVVGYGLATNTNYGFRAALWINP